MFRRLLLAALLVCGALTLPTPTPAGAAPLPLNGLVDLDVGPVGSCAVFTSGAITCWGMGSYGLYAESNTRSRTVPTAVPGVTDAVEVSVGFTETCARLSTLTVQCWGLNYSGQVGAGNTPWVLSPYTIPGLTNVTGLATGSMAVCALISGGTVKCWGSNLKGQTGATPSQNPVLAATTVAGLSGVVKISGSGDTFCALKSDATARCWGSNFDAQIGIGSTGGSVFTPTSPTGLVNVLDISAGQYHTCAVVQSGVDEVVKCWGNDEHHQLGTNVRGPYDTPHSAVPSITDAVQISADQTHTCVRRATGQVACWGDNLAGYLGGGTNGADTAIPVTVSGVSTATEVGVGFSSCALLDDGSLKCWGSNMRGSAGVGDADTVLDSHATPQTLDLPLPEYVPITPIRLLDTRPTGETFDGESEKGGLVLAGATVKVRVRGRGGVPGTAPAVVLNVTAVQPAGVGNVTVWPCNKTKPNASNLNVVAGVTRANLVVATVTSGGPDVDWVCLSPSVDMHLLADSEGYYSTFGHYSAIVPIRMMDTRPSGVTVDGGWQAFGPVAAGATVQLNVGGRGTVPSGATVAMLNVTAVQAAGNGNVTVWPCDQPKPNASNLNVKPGVTVANLVIASLHTDQVCLSPSTSMHLIVDVSGYLSSATPYIGTTPYRILDTRPTGVTSDGLEQAEGAIAAGSGGAVTVIARHGTDLGAGRTIMLNLTAVQPQGNGFVTVYPCLLNAPPTALTSNLNVTAGVTASVAVVVEIGAGDAVCLYSSVTTDLILDVQGWYAY